MLGPKRGLDVNVCRHLDARTARGFADHTGQCPGTEEQAGKAVPQVVEGPRIQSALPQRCSKRPGRIAGIPLYSLAGGKGEVSVLTGGAGSLTTLLDHRPLVAKHGDDRRGDCGLQAAVMVALRVRRNDRHRRSAAPRDAHPQLGVGGARATAAADVPAHARHLGAPGDGETEVAGVDAGGCEDAVARGAGGSVGFGTDDGREQSGDPGVVVLAE